MAVSTHILFRDAMTHPASGVAVITARRPEGAPCGIAATSLTSYSAYPPSLLVSVWHESRCHDALANRELQDKFHGLDWRWDDDVPELAGTLATSAARAAENFIKYDHTILIGELKGARLEESQPLVYARRRMDWLMQPMQ